MGKYQVKEIKDKDVWEKFLLSRSPKSFLQSWNWGETQKLIGKRIFRFGIYSNELQGVCLVIYESAKRGKHLVIPGGPILDWKNRQLVEIMLSEIKRIGKDNQCWFVRVRPELEENKSNYNLFTNLGFKLSPMHLHAQNTWVLDITKDEEDLIKQMRKNTRYEIRKSLKHGLTLKISTDKKEVDVLYELQKQTVKRNKFVGFSRKLFKSQMKTFSVDNQANIFSVYKNKKPLVSAIIIFYADTAYYHHSGSSDEARRYGASYFLQWEVIKHAKLRGIKYYNFWGVAPDNNPRHRFHGVTVFKTGFGGNQINWLPAHDLPLSNLYRLTSSFERIRKKYRRL